MKLFSHRLVVLHKYAHVSVLFNVDRLMYSLIFLHFGDCSLSLNSVQISSNWKNEFKHPLNWWIVLERPAVAVDSSKTVPKRKTNEPTSWCTPRTLGCGLSVMGVQNGLPVTEICLRTKHETRFTEKGWQVFAQLLNRWNPDVYSLGARRWTYEETAVSTSTNYWADKLDDYLLNLH